MTTKKIKTEKTPKTRNIVDYVITDCVYKEKPLINYNWWYRDWGFNPTKSDIDLKVWGSFILSPANPTNTKPFPTIDTSTMTKEEVADAMNKRRTAIVDELSEMWLWNDEKRRKDYAFYERLPFIPPVQIPTWVLNIEKFKTEKPINLTYIEKVALCYILQFTHTHSTGYIECAGDIEKSCMCTVNEAHDAIIKLYKMGFLLDPEFPPMALIGNMYRCASWKVNPLLLKAHLNNQGINFEK